jgi:phage/plasmid primase-like uncharacterized protein
VRIGVAPITTTHLKEGPVNRTGLSADASLMTSNTMLDKQGIRLMLPAHDQLQRNETLTNYFRDETFVIAVNAAGNTIALTTVPRGALRKIKGVGYEREGCTGVAGGGS